MASSAYASACESKITQKLVSFSESEIEAAKLLIQLSSGGDSEEDYHSSINSCNNNNNNNNNNNKVDSGGDVASSITVTAIEDVYVLADEAKDESFGRRKNKKYRYIEDLYSVTEPLSEVKVKKMKYRN